MPLLAQNTLKAGIDAFLDAQPKVLKIYVSIQSLDQKIQYHRNANMLVPAASVIKVPLMVEVMKQIEENKLSLHQKYTLTESDLVGGDGILKASDIGKNLSIKELLSHTMKYSDNTATNVLIEKVGFESTNRRMRLLGFNQLHLNRKMMDTTAIRLGKQNFVSAREMVVLLRKIYLFELSQPKNGRLMLDLLESCNDQSTIPALLPKHIRVAHKSGSLDYVRGDAGIVYAKTPFILAVFVENFGSQSQAEQVIAEVSKICFDFFEK